MNQRDHCQEHSIRRSLYIAVTVALLVGCADSTPKNRKQPVLSPSGKYTLTIAKSPYPQDSTITPIDFPKVYVSKVTITDQFGYEVFRDESSKMSVRNFYWMWGAEVDRVWVYDSDSNVIFFEEEGDEWVKKTWGLGRRRHTSENIWPPSTLYPTPAQLGRGR